MATDSYLLHDRILDGRLGKMLDDWRAEGLSFPEIAFRLRTEHDIKVSDETVRRWHQRSQEPAA